MTFGQPSDTIVQGDLPHRARGNFDALTAPTPSDVRRPMEPGSPDRHRQQHRLLPVGAAPDRGNGRRRRGQRPRARIPDRYLRHPGRASRRPGRHLGPVRPPRPLDLERARRTRAAAGAIAFVENAPCTPSRSRRRHQRDLSRERTPSARSPLLAGVHDECQRHALPSPHCAPRGGVQRHRGECVRRSARGNELPLDDARRNDLHAGGRQRSAGKRERTGHSVSRRVGGISTALHPRGRRWGRPSRALGSSKPVAYLGCPTQPIERPAQPLHADSNHAAAGHDFGFLSHPGSEREQRLRRLVRGRTGRVAVDEYGGRYVRSVFGDSEPTLLHGDRPVVDAHPCPEHSVRCRRMGTSHGRRRGWSHRPWLRAALHRRLEHQQLLLDARGRRNHPSPCPAQHGHDVRFAQVAPCFRRWLFERDPPRGRRRRWGRFSRRCRDGEHEPQRGRIGLRGHHGPRFQESRRRPVRAWRRGCAPVREQRIRRATTSPAGRRPAALPIRTSS